MNERETAMRLARERMFSAELAEVLAVPIARVEQPEPRWHRGSWLAAALVLFGVFVAGGVAWLRAREVTTAQEPRAFDPVFPSYEEGFPWVRDYTLVRDLAGLVALPPEVCHIRLRGSDPDLLAAVVARPGVKKLYLAEFGGWNREIWQALGAMPALEELLLEGRSSVSPENLRELRALPGLRRLMLGSLDCVLDADLGAALVELPKLSSLMLSAINVIPAGIASLAGLPCLEELAIERMPLEDEVVAAIAGLRNLRYLCIHGPDPSQSLEFTPRQMEQLASLGRLDALLLYNWKISDAAMQKVPRQVQSLVLGQDRVSPAGIASLVRLSRLRAICWMGATDAGLEAAKLGLVRKLPFEYVDWRFGGTTPEAWSAFHNASALRGLAVRYERDTVSEVVKLTNLERLRLHCTQLPGAAELAPLTALAKLVRLDVYLDGATQPTDNQLAPLRATLGPRIEIAVR